MIHPLFAEIVDSYFHASHRTVALDDQGHDFEPCPACLGTPGRLADHPCPMCNGTGDANGTGGLAGELSPR